MSDVRVGIVGATGAVGKELLAVLNTSPWRPDTVAAFASRSTKTPYVSYGDDSIAVDDFDAGAAGSLDLLFLAVPRAAAADIARIAGEEGVAVVDCSGVLADDDAPLVVPWVNPEALQGDELIDAVSIPSAAASLVASVVAPLIRAGLIADIDATVRVPASHWGRSGVDELSGQVVALFNSGTPPRKVFESGLAFDLMPQVGAATASGRTDAEDRVVIELSELLGLKVAPRVELIGVPVFSGITASLRLGLTRQTDIALVARILEDGGVGLSDDARSLPRPRRLEGRPFPQVGRIRLDGDRLSLIAGVDNLRGTAAAAVSAAGVLLQRRGIDLSREGRED